MSLNNKESLRKTEEYVEKIKDCLLQLKENENNMENYLKNYLGDNDYEYDKAIINGEKHKNSPNNIDKINALNLIIAHLYMTNVYKKDYINKFGTFGILDDKVETEKNFKIQKKG